MNLTPVFIIFFTIMFGVALGAFWEMYDPGGPDFWGKPCGAMQNSLNDTMLDMIFALAGSVIVALIGIFG